MLNILKNLVGSTLMVLLIDACGGTLGGNPENTAGTAGSGAEPALTIALTDAPVEDAAHVYVTIASVEIAGADGQWTTLPIETKEEVDLLQLQGGASLPLAAIETLPAGSYGQTRLILADDKAPRLIDLSGVEHSLKIPSGSESGLKIQTAFTIAEGQSTALTIDFDLRKSIKVTGNSKATGQGSKTEKYMMKPVLRLVDNDKSGGITGVSTENTILCVYDAGSGADESDSCDKAISSTQVKSGRFKQAFLPAGRYDLHMFRDGVAVGSKSDITVKAGEDTDLGTLLQKFD